MTRLFESRGKNYGSMSSQPMRPIGEIQKKDLTALIRFCFSQVAWSFPKTEFNGSQASVQIDEKGIDLLASDLLKQGVDLKITTATKDLLKEKLSEQLEKVGLSKKPLAVYFNKNQNEYYQAFAITLQKVLTDKMLEVAPRARSALS